MDHQQIHLYMEGDTNMANLRDFLSGVQESLPLALNQYNQGKNRQLEQQKLNQQQQQFEAGFIPGSEANNRIKGLFPEIKVTDIFDPMEKVSNKELDDALNVLQSRMPGGAGQRNPYFSPKGITPEGEQVIFNHRTGEYTTTSGAPAVLPQIKTLPAAESEQSGSLDTISTQLETIKSSFKPEFTGAVEGRLGKVAQVVDVPQLGLGASPERAQFLANVSSIRDQLLRARSGAQINEQEYKRLVQELPDENKSDVDFMAKLANFERVFNEIKANRQAAFQTSGYRVPTSRNDVTPPTQVPTPGLSARDRLLQKMRGQ